MFDANAARANNGAHSDLPFIHSFKCQKIRFIPLSEFKANIDGELKPNSLFEVYLSPQKMKVMGFTYDR